MTKNLIIIALLVLVIYLYYQQDKKYRQLHSFTSDLIFNPSEDSGTNQTLTSFLRDNLNSNSLEELKTKLGEKTLNEILEENEDWETEVDTLTRTKNSLEQDLTAQAEAFQTRQREKDREIKKLKEDFASEKQQHKGSLGRINKLTEQITKLEKQLKKMPGEFPGEDKLEKEHQEQLRKIYTLFDLRAKGMKEIDFNQLYELIEKVNQKTDLRKLAHTND